GVAEGHCPHCGANSIPVLEAAESPVLAGPPPARPAIVGEPSPVDAGVSALRRLPRRPVQSRPLLCLRSILAILLRVVVRAAALTGGGVVLFQVQAKQGAYARGVAALNRGDYDGVFAECPVAVRRDPQFAAAYACRSSALIGKGQFDQALADANEAIRLD